MIYDTPERDEQDAAICRDGLHALGMIRDMDTFWGMALNYTGMFFRLSRLLDVGTDGMNAVFGTVLPWAPCHCSDPVEEDEVDYEDEMKADPKEDNDVSQFPDVWVTKGREKWDPLFKRAMANALDVQCMWEKAPGGCLGREVCVFRHTSAK